MATKIEWPEMVSRDAAEAIRKAAYEAGYQDGFARAKDAAEPHGIVVNTRGHNPFCNVCFALVVHEVGQWRHVGR